MSWNFGNPAMHLWLFRAFLGFGLLIATVAFLLMGKPFSAGKSDRGRPILGLFCGLIFGASFCLLGFQMIAGRFFKASLVDSELTLELADGRLVHLAKQQITSVSVTAEHEAKYLVITTRDKEFYRGGPFEACDEARAEIQAWLLL